MTKIICLVVFSVLLLGACGGSGSKGPNASASFTVRDNRVNFKGEINGSTPESKSVIGHISNAESNVYIYVEINQNGVLAQANVSISGNLGELVLYPQNPSNLGEGLHSDTVTVRVCNDANCKSHISGSPRVIVVQYDVYPDPDSIDSDNDGVPDYLDTFPFDPTESEDKNGDGLGDNTDSDNDGTPDIHDAFPHSPFEINDYDNDDTGDNADLDDDNDGVLDGNDDFPLNAAVSTRSSTLAFNISGAGKVSINDEIITCEQECIIEIENTDDSDENVLSIKALADANYTFEGTWGSGNNCAEDSNTCNMNSSHSREMSFDLTFEENMHFTINADISNGGGFTDRFGWVNCVESCGIKLYQQKFDTIILQPLSRLGYVFDGWSGDCEGSGHCVIEFNFDSTTNIQANFIPSTTKIELCDDEKELTFNDFGVVTLPKVGEFLPLCNGQVLVADQTNSSVIWLDAVNQINLKTFALAGVPEYLALDEENALLYASHGTSNFISRINLATDQVSQIYIENGAQSLAVSSNGVLFANQNNHNRVNAYNSSTGIFIKTLDVIGNYLVFNDHTQRLITAAYNYSFDKSDISVTQLGSSSGYGSGNGCDRVYVSPDGEHTAKPCGAGNGPGYSIYDYYSYDPSIVLGIWDTGAYPSGASFSPSSNYAFLTNRSQLQLFSTQTYEMVFESPAPYCSYGNTRKVAVSIDEKLLYAITTCGFYRDSAKLTWIAFDTSK